MNLYLCYIFIWKKYYELIAHTAAAERLGRNWAFSQAAEMIAEVLREMDEIGPTQEVKPIKTDFDSRPMSENGKSGCEFVSSKAANGLGVPELRQPWLNLVRSANTRMVGSIK